MPIRARHVRWKSFREYLLDLKKPEDERSDFVYASSGEDVPRSALVVHHKGDDEPAEKLRRLENILSAYADSLGWSAMEIGDEEDHGLW